MEFKEIYAGNSGHIYRLQKIDEILKILTTESELGRKYNKGAAIINSIDMILGATAIGLGITGVGLHQL